MMKKEYAEKIVKAAQEKFEIAKNIILEEMQDVLNAVDEHMEDDLICESIVNAFANVTVGINEDECCEEGCDECCEECCGECCEDCGDMMLINPDAVDFDEDYREVSLLFKDFTSDGRGVDVAIECDADIDIEAIPALCGKAIGEALYAVYGEESSIKKCEVEEIVHKYLCNILADVTTLAIAHVFEEALKNDR